MNWRRFFFLRKSTANKAVADYLHSTFGFRPKSTTLYEQSFRHSSAAQKIKGGIKDSNERLEFLGDSVLDSIVAHYLYEKYGTLPEGELTKMKSKVVRRENLNALGYDLGLDRMLKLNLGRQEMHDSIVGNALEALIGAIYLDKGYDFTLKLILAILKKRGLDTTVLDDIDYKSKLHEWGQKNKKPLEFKVLEHRNEGGSSYYHIQLLVDGKVMGQAEGNSKKVAEQKCAAQAYQQLK
jgi:ribonuclease III